MIPAAWEPYHRPDDGEHVGYLRPDGDLVVPCTLLGTALAEPLERDDAETVLDDVGLSYLAETWLLIDDDGTQRRVVLVEVDAARAVVTDAGSALVVGAPADERGRREVSLPTDRLRLR
ncbi:hypothetical protein [Aeromicrobium sp. 50.2.37]|uniref:hypothetical protein n=1 Tax=Aeromicrobium sp. 50.2.37 TaxID=2969305 RepID=UPI00214FD183|nr:hypothetical protein [Aeromicrobium sp. 50.2.37]MCR4511895.1 hypothetical protein [Aeromicrobium sp. 50.2.37]